MLIYAAFLSERLRYILDEIFVYRLGLEYKHTDSMDYFRASTSFRVCYHTEIEEGCVNIPAGLLLYEDDILLQQPVVKEHKRWKHIFFENAYEQIPDFRKTTLVLPFDVLSATFYLITRYEEYLPTRRDEHQRFRAESSLAFKAGFIEFPLVDHWINQMATLLKEQFPAIKLAEPTFKQVNTIDVDFAYKYHGLSLLRRLRKAAGSLFRGRFDPNTLKAPETDPYDTYDLMTKSASDACVESVFFFLLADYGGNDMAHPVSSREFANLMKSLAEKYRVGIHPSYRSAGNEQVLRDELKKFQEIVGVPAKISRNHFLRLKFPSTYVSFHAHGINEDYTLLHASCAGFRASTSKPFRFFNLSSNTVLPFLVQPVCLMDVTLKNAMRLQPAAAIEKIRKIKESVKTVKGNFVTLWHNSSFDPAEGWEGWDLVYRSLYS